MLTFYDWKIRRSGAGMRVYGTAVDAAGVIHKDAKLTNIGEVTIRDGRLIVSNRDTHAVVAFLSLYHSPRT